MTTHATKRPSRRKFLKAAAALTAAAAIPLPKIHDAYAGGEFMGVVGRNEQYPEHDYLLVDLGYSVHRMSHAQALVWAKNQGCYPRWVQEGRMKQAKADAELAAMRAVLDTLKVVARGEA